MSVKMKLRGTAPVAVSSSLSNAELYKHVDSAFPDLTGPLAELLRRFGTIVGEGEDNVFPATASCPACGSVLDIELE